LTERAFLHEVRTFLAEPESEETLGKIRQLTEQDHAGQEEQEKGKAASRLDEIKVKHQLTPPVL
jgi:hypothetical protein